MKTRHLFMLTLALMMATCLATAVRAQTSKTKMITQKPVMKMTTPIPENRTTTDKVETMPIRLTPKAWVM
ncbi:MAG: hypothetical protein JRJ85_22170 [Deltaproteobacteria bacterium]|nr:hypothetical protein [Deltaproteobacteria bacterium]